MSTIKGVWAEPGGRVVLTFTADGYAADRETWEDWWERRSDRLFPMRRLVIALGITFVLALSIRGVFGALSEALVFPTAVVAVLFFLYFAIGMILRTVPEYAGFIGFLLAIVTFPLLVIPAYRRWLLRTRPPVHERKGFVHAGHIRRAEVSGDGEQTAVTLWLANGTWIRYTAHGPAGRELRARFRHLLGDRISAG